MTSIEKFERMIKNQRRLVFLLWLQQRKGAG